MSVCPRHGVVDPHCIARHRMWDRDKACPDLCIRDCPRAAGTEYRQLMIH